MRRTPPETMFGIENEYGTNWPDLAKIRHGNEMPDTSSSEWATDLFTCYFGFLVSREKPLALLRPDNEPLPEDPRLAWLWPNGSKIHADVQHPEYSTPECDNPYMASLHIKAGEYLFEIILRNLNRKIALIDKRNIEVIISRRYKELMETAVKLPKNALGPIGMQKNNTDLRGNSYGTHENYLCLREKILNDARAVIALTARQFDKIRYNLIPFLLTRQIFAGAGGFWKNSKGDWHYVLSPRALKTSMLFSHSSTVATPEQGRPCISIKDEPFADKKYYRLHIVMGDALMSEFATYLALGTTWVIISMIQDGWLNEDLLFQFENPDAPENAINSEKKLDAENKIIEYLHAISLEYAANPNIPIPITGKGNLTPLEIQYQYLLRAKEYFIYVRKPTWWEKDIMQKWEMALELLRTDSPEKIRYIEWASKLALMNSIIKKRTGIFEKISERKSTRIPSEVWEYRIKSANGKKTEKAGNIMLASSIQYADIRKPKSLYWALVRKGLVSRLFSETQIKQAIRFPPWTRAMLREYVKFAAKKRGLNMIITDWNQGQITLGADKEQNTQIFKTEPPFGGETLWSEMERFEKWLDGLVPKKKLSG